ncbi:MAG: hypothetical protein HUK40_17205 [Desulfobacter sp.]|nr:hypothetical protein [Desulfobacter sp.]
MNPVPPRRHQFQSPYGLLPLVPPWGLPVFRTLVVGSFLSVSYKYCLTRPTLIYQGVSVSLILSQRASIKISAHCNRVAVTHGHTACVSLEFGNFKPKLDEIVDIWRGFRATPQYLELPFAPKRPIIYRGETDRPQPQKDRESDKAMSVSVGRLRRCNVFDIRFIGLHHNTIRGAAGGAVLTAELLKVQGYLS